METKFLPLAAIDRIFKEAQDELVVISGGEPFEYYDLPSLFHLLKGVKTNFRIATGGHISLIGYWQFLKDLPNLQGISLGTDVLSPRSPKYNDHKKIWAANVGFLNANHISYSLTFTIQDDLRVQELIAETSSLGSLPEFIYLRISANKNRQLVINFLEQTFPEASIIIDELCS